MTRLYVGIACTAHDPAVAVVNEQGELVYAQAAERGLQYKRAWFSLPISKEFLQRAVVPHLTADTEIVVATSWLLDSEIANVASKISQPADLASLEGFPSLIIGTLATRANSYLQLREMLKRWLAAGRIRYSGTEVTLKCYDHHATHAANACYSSPYEEAVCAVIDGYGEGSSTAYYRWQNGSLTPLEGDTASPGGSLGFFYANLCNACGFDSNAGEEWKVMGLAAYGKFDRYLYDLLSPLLVVNELQLLRGNEPGRRWLEARLHVGRDATPIQCADLAFTGQKLFEEASGALLRSLQRRALSENLVLGGGSALNSSWNGRIAAACGFRSLFVPSAPADDGNAAGAAWLAFREDHPDWRPSRRVQSAYLGDELQEHSLRNAIEHGGLRPVSSGTKSVARYAAELLARGKIIGWAQGRAEFGPRALGNRSILADARNPDIKRIINARVKFREEFRPFAPSILHERGAEYFEDYQESPYMDRALLFRQSIRSKVPGVVHEDGTGRVQSVRRESNPRFHDLIAEFDAITGVPLVLNTSFNVMGKPIIHSVEDAIAVYMTSGLDALVIGNTIFEKDSRAA